MKGEEETKHMMQVWLVLGGLPLILYPGVVIASIMGLAAPGDDLEATLLRLWSIATLIYPVIYIGMGLVAWRSFKYGDYARTRWTSLVPVLYLGFLFLFFWAMIAFGPPDSA